jgi:hypothetical protein
MICARYRTPIGLKIVPKTLRYFVATRHPCHPGGHFHSVRAAGEF